MSIAKTVQWFLETHGVSYETLQHPYSRTSEETADVAFIWEDQLAKTVLLEDEKGYVAAVVPASYRVDLKKLGRQLGAVPPLGEAYGIETVYDDRLRRLACVYFEGGDHRDLIYIGGREFINLLRGSPHGDLCRAA